MKPCGEWRTDFSDRRRFRLVVGPLEASVRFHQPRVLRGKHIGWKDYPEGWYIEVGEFEDGWFGVKHLSPCYKTVDEAKLAAEAEISRMIGTAVREGSRLGLYGRKKVVREIRSNRK
jgi:hypothetical protein